MKAKRILKGSALLTLTALTAVAVMKVTMGTVPFIALLIAARLFHITIAGGILYAVVKWAKRHRQKKLQACFTSWKNTHDATENK